jgi:beta-hydroxylase
MPVENQSWIVKTGKRLRKVMNRAIVRWSAVEDTPVFDSATFPWTAELERNWEAIRAEAEKILAFRDAVPPLGAISPDHKRLAADDKWKSYFMWGYGFRMNENCARCPETVRLVEAIPGLKTAMFSIHAPGVHIPRHKGATKGMITCHLALIVPKQGEKCRMQVAEQMCHWQEGRTLVFDDTYHHEVWNDSDEDRVILLVQFARPLLLPGRIISNLFLAAIRWSPFVQDARRNMGGWEQRLKQMEGGKRA